MNNGLGGRWILSAVLLLSAGLACASEGGYEISQACVADGCFAGDTPGFPITLTQSGNYYFTSNLVVPDQFTTAVSVAASDVTLDLRGFLIKGPVACTGGQAQCTPADGTGVGILAGAGTTNISVEHGTITGLGFKGVELRSRSRIQRMRLENSFRAGASLGAGSDVIDSSANKNGYLGLEAVDSRLVDFEATRNGQAAINCARCVVDRATVHDNEGVGMFDGYGSVVTASVFSRNGVGIWSINGGTRVIDTQFVANSGVGFFAQPAVPPDTPSGETLVSTLSGNSFIENNGGNANSQIGGSGGLWVQLGPNLCGRSITCP